MPLRPRPTNTKEAGSNIRIRHRVRSLTGGTVAVALVAIASTCGVASEASATPLYPTPNSDDFYTAPTGYETKEPGDVLKVRQLPAPVGFLDTTAVQIQFRSTNSQNNPIAAITTVLSPAHETPDRPLLSYQHIINALGTDCAPSRTLYSSDPDLQIREAVGLNVALQRGWSVAIPDHLGPTSAYGAARLGGQITLDGIRAAKQLPDLHLATSPVGLAGYSGGGMATAWAAALAVGGTDVGDAVPAVSGGRSSSAC